MRLVPLLIAALVGCLHADDDVRMDCHPEPDANQDNCEARNCIWLPPPDQQRTMPWCYMKKGIGYVNASTSGSVVTLKKNNGPRNPWGDDIDQIQLKSGAIGKTLNVKIFVDGRYDPPVGLPKKPSVSSDTLQFDSGISNDVFYFVIKRKSTGRRLFDTSIGGLIFSDKFLQIATYLPSDAMYGWGENVHLTLKHNFSNYRTWGMLARDEPPNSAGLDTKNLYGVHPFYMMLEPDGNAHGVFILNSNAQEVTTAPGPALIYRTIGGNLDMYFFPGPSPEEVTQQYLALIGTPFLPAYWALGYQISRYGYKDVNEMSETIGRNMKAGIPLDTAVADIDYMDRYKDFTTGKNWTGLSDYVKQLHSWGMRSILIFDPAIQVDYESFQRGINANARFIEWERPDQVMHSIQDKYPLVKDTKIMLGVVWPDRHVAFPDFFDPTNVTQSWWIQEFSLYHQQVPFDGIWIDMNEPANFGTNEANPWYFDSPDHPDDQPLMCPMNSTDGEWDMPPFKTHAVYNYGQGAYLATKTLCMLGVQANGTERFYNLKNLYGWSEAKATQQAQHAATGKRGAVISRSTFSSSGRFAGHWLGDNTARWEDLQTSVIGVQEFNLFGIPYVGSDICGFNGQTNEELCLRWQQMGAFHSFMRNHNSDDEPPQDPALWPSVAAATKKANLFRYKYMPYLFSLHFVASMYGGTVVRPIFYEFPHDLETHDLGHQFLWGSSMLIAPVLYQGATSVNVYLPEDDWYSLFDYQYGQLMQHGYQEYPAPWTSQIPVFVRGGSILPRQSPNLTTTATRQSAFDLLIAPKTTSDEDSTNGFLYWDDGESIIYSYVWYDNYYYWTFKYHADSQNGYLSINTERQAKSLNIPTVDTLEIFNYNYYPDFSSFMLNGKKVNINVQTSSYNPHQKILYISTKNLIDISGQGSANLSWKHSSGDSSVWNSNGIDADDKRNFKRRYDLFI
uniref:P-type domain-containing protein n=1 Tax=Haemonchus contortus TaxID=6289 RepID=A0A7I4Y3Y9_HAECO